MNVRLSRVLGICRRAATAIAWLVGVIMVAALMAAAVWCQFEVYQKKHGDKMTFVDFLLDAERK